MKFLDKLKARRKMKIYNNAYKRAEIIPITMPEITALVEAGEYRKVSIDNKFAHGNSLLQLIPTAGNLNLKGKVDADKAGDLYRLSVKSNGLVPYQYKEGSYGTMVRNSSNTPIEAHVKYDKVEAEDIPTRITSANLGFTFFSLMSYATGQYFMKQNNEKLCEILEGINEVKAFLDYEVLSEIEADYNFLNDAVNHQADFNIELHKAYLANILATKKNIDKDLIMTRHMIERVGQKVSERDKKDVISRNSEKLIELAFRYKLLSDLYMVASLLEVSYSGSTSSDFLKIQKEDIDKKAFECMLVINQALGQQEELYKSAKTLQYSKVKHVLDCNWFSNKYSEKNALHIGNQINNIKGLVNAEEHSEKLKGYSELLLTLDMLHNRTIDVVVGNDCLYLKSN